MEERQTLCNMAIEAGGKNGIIPADDVTKKYVDARNAGNRPYTVSTLSSGNHDDDIAWLVSLRKLVLLTIYIHDTQIFQADADASYHSKFAYDLASLEPVVAKPHSPDNRELAKNCRDIKVSLRHAAHTSSIGHQTDISLPLIRHRLTVYTSVHALVARQKISSLLPVSFKTTKSPYQPS